MKKIEQWSKSIILFLVGIVLIVWGYYVNASNNYKKKTVNDTDSSQPLKKTGKAVSERSDASNEKPDSIPVPNGLDKHEEKTTDGLEAQKKKRVNKKHKKNIKKAQTKTVIESSAKTEESSATH